MPSPPYLRNLVISVNLCLISLHFLFQFSRHLLYFWTGGSSGDVRVQLKSAELRDTMRKAISFVAIWITQNVPVIIPPLLPRQIVSSVSSLVGLLVADLQACKLVGAGLVGCLPCWGGREQIQSEFVR